VSCVFSGNKELLDEDYFSQGGVAVRHSFVDAPVNWPTCKTAELQFVSPDQNNYLLAPNALASNGFEVALPEWANLNHNGHTPRLPGILSDPVRLMNGQVHHANNK
jgi:hypothetical protein